MRLADLIPSWTGAGADLVVDSLCVDSRQARPGCVYGAFPGSQLDGAQFIPQAVAAGAVAVVAKPGTVVPTGVTFIPADNPRDLIAQMAARLFAPQPELLVAATGTNGKTSSVSMCGQVAAQLKRRWATVGTLGIITPAGVIDTGMTSPDVVTFHQALGRLAREGTDFVAFEASSHALDQYRVDGVRLASAGFTNLSRDHLDYHGSMDAYAGAKEALFSRVLGDGVAVINIDDPVGADFAARAAARGQRLLSVGTAPGARLRLTKREILQAGQHLALTLDGAKHDVLLPLVGAFQAENALVAAGMMIGAGFAPDAVFDALSRLTGIPGRLELVATTAQGAAVYVDYAHTPDGLRAALQALRPHTRSKLHVVFGCGGDRDKGKRPQMGAIATELADRVIVTDDNPRTEDAATIRAEVMVGAPGARNLGGRAEAIAYALAQAGQGDVVLIAGKGHETGQIIGTTVYPFSDADVARELAA
jgi:UDP-N-acetylmuramoyl-L-alanyl-D-glutamate--2,6-diaminopimelate ligase